MPKFKISFERDYTITEGIERIIDAPSLAEALAAAEHIAVGFNHDTPDDLSEIEAGNTVTGDFYSARPREVTQGTVDFEVLPDGQIIPGRDDEGAAMCLGGMHSWIGMTGKLPADTACTRCGELYGDPS